MYDTHCWYCHGDEGDGNGPVAEYLWPRPRDFTIGSFKLRTTGSGELPVDEDLFRSISLGLPGTAMPAWEGTLSSTERWQVIAYIKTFADGMFEDEAFDPYDARVPIGRPPGDPADALAAAGRRVYEESDCWECHGMAGRGDGEKAPDLEDDWGFPIHATDLERSWRFRGGRTAADVYARLTTGLDGTPMPSYAESLSDEERWQVAHYVATLDPGGQDGSPDDAVIVARRIAGGVPDDAGDPAWDLTEDVHIPMSGQATFSPRWQTPSVTDLSVRALYDAAQLVLRIAWNDPTPDTLAGDTAAARIDGWAGDETFPALYPGGRRARGRYRDALEVMAPTRRSGGPVLPHFVYGDAGRPVDLWRWTAGAGRGSAVDARRARGPEIPVPRRGGRTVTGNGSWVEGRWTVMLRYPLHAAADTSPGPFAPNVLAPVAFHAWDGGNGETGLRMALSSWYYVYLREPTRPLAYVTVVLAVLAALAAEYGLVRALRRRAARGRLGPYGVAGGDDAVATARRA